jgi:hypothetical protein
MPLAKHSPSEIRGARTRATHSCVRHMSTYLVFFHCRSLHRIEIVE